MTVRTVLAEARIRDEAAKSTPSVERLEVLVDQYIAAQIAACRRQQRRDRHRA